MRTAEQMLKIIEEEGGFVVYNGAKPISIPIEDRAKAEQFCHDWLTDDWRSRLPWTRDRMTPEEFGQWVAGRKEAAQKIDVETCEIGCWYVGNGDGYGFDGDYCDKCNFVRSPGSDGWVSEADLPMEKWRALSDRIKREHDSISEEEHARRNKAAFDALGRTH